MLDPLKMFKVRGAYQGCFGMGWRQNWLRQALWIGRFALPLARGETMQFGPDIFADMAH